VTKCFCHDFFEPDEWENILKKEVENLKKHVTSLTMKIMRLENENQGGNDG